MLELQQQQHVRTCPQKTNITILIFILILIFIVILIFILILTLILILIFILSKSQELCSPPSCPSQWFNHKCRHTQR